MVTESLSIMRWSCIGSLDMLGYEVMRSPMSLQGAALFVPPEPGLGVSRQDIQRRIRCWLVNQHWIWWQGLGDTQRQAQELISGSCLGSKVRFLSFNRQSRVVKGLLTGHNTLRRHLHLIGLSDSPLCRRCGAEDETSAHILCECEAVASLRRVSGLLLLGARGHQEYKFGGHLEL